jgi:hypothetical protein
MRLGYGVPMAAGRPDARHPLVAQQSRHDIDSGAEFAVSEADGRFARARFC